MSTCDISERSRNVTRGALCLLMLFASPPGRICLHKYRQAYAYIIVKQFYRGTGQESALRAELMAAMQTTQNESYVNIRTRKSFTTIYNGLQ
jgi:hypothetical protein